MEGIDNQDEGKSICSSSPNSEIEKIDSSFKEDQLGLNQLEIIRSLKNLLELKDGHNESLADITAVINQAIPNCDPFNIHTCLVKTFPDLQAQQSTDSNEIYYLGIQFANNLATEDRVIDWLKQRFSEDEFGSVSYKTMLDIVQKELGQISVTRVSSLVRKAFPKVYQRRSDRVRWYCGITLPEKELSQEEKDGKVWLANACKWLRQNMVRDSTKQEKCSIVYSALSQFIGKTNGEKYMSSVKVVFPDVQKKVIAHQAYYDGIGFVDENLRDRIKGSHPSKFKPVPQNPLLLTEGEADVVEWLRFILREKDSHREKLLDIAHLLSKKFEEVLTEKTALSFLRKAFTNLIYRKRDGISYVTGIEIKPSYRPKDVWVEKATTWLKQIFRPTLNESFHKLQRFIDVIKPGLQCSNQAKCCKVLLSAFPSAFVKKTDDGRYISGIELNENYHLVSSPSFTAEDCYGDFTNVSVNVDESSAENLTIDTTYNEGESQHTEGSTGGSCTTAVNTRCNSSDADNRLHVPCLQMEGKLNKLIKTTGHLESEMKNFKEETGKSLERTNNIISNMTEEIKSLRQELNQATHQRDTLIIQLQQTLMLLSQQQYQKILKQTLPQAQPLASTPSNGLPPPQEIYDTGENMMTMQALQNLHDSSMSKQL